MMEATTDSITILAEDMRDNRTKVKKLEIRKRDRSGRVLPRSGLGLKIDFPIE